MGANEIIDAVDEIILLIIKRKKQYGDQTILLETIYNG